MSSSLTTKREMTPTDGVDGRASTSASASALAASLDVLRVSQVDSQRLDVELLDTLNGQLSRVVDAVVDPSGEFSTRKSAEIKLFLDLGLFVCTTAMNRPTPGQDLMNLRFRDEREWSSDSPGAIDVATVKTGVEGSGLTVTQRLILGFVRCAAGYAWGSWQRKMLRERFDEGNRDEWRYKAWKWSQRIENAHATASFINFCIFLKNGRYPTLIERAVSARLVYQRPSMARVVDFEYLNQQLAWRELSELVLFTLPYLYSSRVRSLFGVLSMATSRTRSSVDAVGHTATNDESSTTSRRRVIQAFRCSACASREPIHPFVAEPCGHPYCYYCLRARMLEQRLDCRCVRCSKPVKEMRRLATLSS